MVTATALEGWPLLNLSISSTLELGLTFSASKTQTLKEGTGEQTLQIKWQQIWVSLMLKYILQIKNESMLQGWNTFYRMRPLWNGSVENTERGGKNYLNICWSKIIFTTSLVLRNITHQPKGKRCWTCKEITGRTNLKKRELIFNTILIAICNTNMLCYRMI